MRRYLWKIRDAFIAERNLRSLDKEKRSKKKSFSENFIFRLFNSKALCAIIEGTFRRFVFAPRGKQFAFLSKIIFSDKRLKIHVR